MVKLTEGQKNALLTTLGSLTAHGRGILASDESTGTIGKRLVKAGLENTEEVRRCYRELLYTGPIGYAGIGGVILFNETLGQSASDGRSFVECLTSQGVLVGIKVDEGLEMIEGTEDGETHTKGMATLRERIVQYKAQGAVFAKWRAALRVSEAGLPSAAAIAVNAQELAEYARICQENGLVPIVEPELLIDGAHSMERFAAASEQVLHAVMHALWSHGVFLEGCLIKPQMIVPGTEYAGERPSSDDIARETLKVLRRTVPAAVPGIMFLSGGMSESEATENLNAINQMAMRQKRAPWHLSFSFGRGLQASVLDTWKGKAENAEAAREMAVALAKANSAACKGIYKEPHPSTMVGSLHETFRGWSGVAGAGPTHGTGDGHS